MTTRRCATVEHPGAAEIRLGEVSPKGHDDYVFVLLLVLLAGAALVLASARTRPRGSSAAASGAGALSGWWLLAALLLGLLLVRMGLSRLALIGGGALALLRALAPLLRFWPLFLQWSRQAGSAGAGYANAPGSGAGDAGPARPARMSRREALEVLGLDERATREDVQREYRRLIKRLHPDLGGSTYLTAKLNEARDVLS